jgi:hypothetical protein
LYEGVGVLECDGEECANFGGGEESEGSDDFMDRLGAEFRGIVGETPWTENVKSLYKPGALDALKKGASWDDLNRDYYRGGENGDNDGQ